MDPARVQRNLRDLINLPGEISATPGVKVGQIAAGAAGQRAMEAAKARGEESRIGLKELALAKQGEAWQREMDIGESQANRATLFAGLGAAIKLGDAHLVQKKADEIVAKLVGREKIYDEMKAQHDGLLAILLEEINKRKQNQKGAYGGTPSVTPID